MLPYMVSVKLLPLRYVHACVCGVEEVCVGVALCASSLRAERPEIVRFDYSRVQSSVQFLCDVFNRSTPYVVMFLQNGRPINMSLPGSRYSLQVLEQTDGSFHHVLTIRDVSPDDAGQYTCLVGSPHNSVEQQRTVNLSASFLSPTLIVPSMGE